MNADHASQTVARKWAFDRTLNIPTLLTIGAMVATVTAFGVSTINERDQRVAVQDRRIDSVERKADSALESIKRLDVVQSMQVKNSTEQMQTLRSEFRSDLKEISGKLDTILMNSAGFRAETKDWTK